MASLKKFKGIRQLAEKRKGGKKVLDSLLPKPLSSNQLSQIADDRYLAQMTQCVFNAGFHWRVITQKWPGFEEAFHEFDLDALLSKSPDEWEQYLNDDRIVRNWQKIQTVYANAALISEISQEHDGFGRFMAAWPSEDQVGLLELLKKRGSRLGGQTAQYFIRFMGKDGFVTSKDVIAALQANGVEIANSPTSKRDMNKIQDAFNTWHQETGLPYTHISKILSYTVGDNIPADRIQQYQGDA